MREIKFRAWDAFNKEMFFSDGRFDGEFLEEIVEGKYPAIILMQYIGLKDKNGVEIYEGYIIKTNTQNIVSIEYDNYFAAYLAGGFPLTQKDIERLDIEVIGNIYENPELLDK